jgi:hypothetical protein
MLFADRTWKRKRGALRPRTSLLDPVELPETREPFGSEDSGVPAAQRTTPMPEDQKGKEQPQARTGNIPSGTE